MKKTTPRLRPAQRVLIAFLAIFTALPFISVSVASANPLEVNATVKANPTNAQVSIASGSLAIQNGYLVVRNDVGAVVEKVRLSFINTDNRTYPIDATIKGRTATLTPSTDYARSKATPAATLRSTEKQRAAAKRNAEKQICGPQTRAQRDDEALNRMSTELGIAITIGALVGGVIGAILGIVGVVTIPIGGAIGVVVGAVLGLGGAAIAGTFTRYFMTINSPFVKRYC